MNYITSNKNLYIILAKTRNFFIPFDCVDVTINVTESLIQIFIRYNVFYYNEFDLPVF